MNKVPYLQAALLCEGVETDASGRYTIKNEFSEYTMGYSKPMTVFTIWRGNSEVSEEAFYQKVEILAPDGRVVAAGQNEKFTLADNTYRQVNVLLFDKVDFTHDGRYEWRVGLYQDDGTLAVLHRYSLVVV